MIEQTAEMHMCDIIIRQNGVSVAKYAPIYAYVIDVRNVFHMKRQRNENYCDDVVVVPTAKRVKRTPCAPCNDVVFLMFRSMPFTTALRFASASKHYRRLWFRYCLYYGLKTEWKALLWACRFGYATPFLLRRPFHNANVLVGLGRSALTDVLKHAILNRVDLRVFQRLFHVHSSIHVQRDYYNYVASARRRQCLPHVNRQQLACGCILDGAWRTLPCSVYCDQLRYISVYNLLMLRGSYAMIQHYYTCTSTAPKKTLWLPDDYFICLMMRYARDNVLAAILADPNMALKRTWVRERIRHYKRTGHYNIL